MRKSLMRSLVALAVLAAAACGNGRSRRPKVRIWYAVDLAKAVETRGAPGEAVEPPRAVERRARALARTLETLRVRARPYGVDAAWVTAHGERIAVEVPGLYSEDRARLMDVLARRGELTLQLVEHDGPTSARLVQHVGLGGEATEPGARDRQIVAHRRSWAHHATGVVFVEHYLTAEDREETVPVDEAEARGCPGGRDLVVRRGMVQCQVSGRQVLSSYLDELFAADPTMRPADHPVSYGRFVGVGGRTHWRTYELRPTPGLSGPTVERAEVTRDARTGDPAIRVVLDAAGARALAALTAENVGRKLAVVIDDEVQSASVIEGPVDGGGLTFALGNVLSYRPEEEARVLVEVLRTGALPAPLRAERVEEVSPSSAP